MIFSDITDGNINLYAMKVYDNPMAVVEDTNFDTDWFMESS